MPEIASQSKHPVEIQQNTMSNPAKLLAAYMRLTGTSDAKQIAADLDIPIRTVQRLKLECATAIYGVDANSAKCANDATGGVFEAPNAPYMAPPIAPIAPPVAFSEVGTEVATRAPKESFQDKSYLEVKKDSPLAPQGGRTSPKRGSRLDGDWTLPDDWRMWARTNFPASTDASVADQAAQFRDYWVAKPGAQACKLDWEATWRNWCRKGLSAVGHVRQPQHTGSWNQDKPIVSTPDRLSAKLRAIERAAA